MRPLKAGTCPQLNLWVAFICNQCLVLHGAKLPGAHFVHLSSRSAKHAFSPQTLMRLLKVRRQQQPWTWKPGQLSVDTGERRFLQDHYESRIFHSRGFLDSHAKDVHSSSLQPISYWAGTNLNHALWVTKHWMLQPWIKADQCSNSVQTCLPAVLLASSNRVIQMFMPEVTIDIPGLHKALRL